MTDFINHCTIDAQLIEKEQLRFTPAGVPVSTGRFHHQSAVLEGERPRILDFEFHAVAVGPIGNALDGYAVGLRYRLTGFLAPKTKRSRQWMLHIQTIEKLED